MYTLYIYASAPASFSLACGNCLKYVYIYIYMLVNLHPLLWRVAIVFNMYIYLYIDASEPASSSLACDICF